MSLRIVGGVAKGRRLAVPASGTRPTSEMAREALFNTLAGYLDLEGARVLDLFAGSGAVGLEALSRGAAEVVFVESRRAALDVLRRNVGTVGLPGATVVGRAATQYLAAEPDTIPFDLVFADPPYDLDDLSLTELLAALDRGGWLKPTSYVVVERAARSGAVRWVGSLTPVREKKYGDSVLWYGRPR